MNPKQRNLEIETLLVTSRFRVQRVQRQLADGQMHAREIVRHPGAVVILPILDDGRICLIRNYRVAVDQVLLELPAGTREPGEAAIATAKRELAEETGYRCRTIRPLCEFYMSPGILDEQLFAFVATDLIAGTSAQETGEEIENLLVSTTDIDELLRTGQIQDSKTLSTLLFYLRFSA